MANEVTTERFLAGLIGLLTISKALHDWRSPIDMGFQLSIGLLMIHLALPPEVKTGYWRYGEGK